MAVVDGIEFRSVTVVAYKGKQGPCFDHGQAVVFKGPWKAVLDDDEHVYERGVATAVCAKTFDLLAAAPYAGAFELLEPAEPVDPAAAPPFACAPPATLTPTGPAQPLRRSVSGLTTTACDPASGCC